MPFNKNRGIIQNEWFLRCFQAAKQKARLLNQRFRIIPFSQIVPRGFDYIDLTAKAVSEIEHFGKHTGKKVVVGLYDGNVFALGHIQTAIARCAIALVGLIDANNARIPTGVLMHNGR